MPAGPSRPSTETPIALRMPEPSSCAEASTSSERRSSTISGPSAANTSPASERARIVQRSPGRRPVPLADRGERVQLDAVDLDDRAAVGVEALDDDLGGALRELADVGGDERDPAELGGGLAVAGAAVERLDRAAALGDVLDLRVHRQRAAAVVAHQRDRELAPHERAVLAHVALLHRVVARLAREQAPVQAPVDLACRRAR